MGMKRWRDTRAVRARDTATAMSLWEERSAVIPPVYPGKRLIHREWRVINKVLQYFSDAATSVFVAAQVTIAMVAHPGALQQMNG